MIAKSDAPKNLISQKLLSVLLVEDSAIAAELIQDHLLSALPGASVEHVTTLAAALERLDDTWDVVLTDLGLPDSEGLSTLLRMRERAPTLPMVVLTANDDAELALEALEEHAQDFLVKQRIDADSLSRAIRYAIGRQQIYARLQAAAAEAGRNEANLYQLIARSSDGILVLNADLCVLYANEAACQLVGRARGELIGELVTELPLLAAHSEVVVPHLDGPSSLIDVRVVEVDWEGQPARMALLRDMTERRSSEELRLQLERSERLASVGQLAAGVAHEINNPLAYVISNLELLIREVKRLEGMGVDTSRMEARIEPALEGSRRVAQIVRDLGSFSRRDNDDPPAPSDVNTALEGALTMASTQIRHRATVHRELGDVPLVQANSGRLAQVFLNLLINAAHSMEEGATQKNRLTLRSRREGTQVVVEISDTGSGINGEHLARAFEPFFTTKRVGEGSGLGLYICRNIVRSYGGTIELESRPGQGTLARVKLPLWARRSERPSAAPPSMRPRPRSAPRGRVLVIDDEPNILDVLRDCLLVHHEVVCAASGQDAMALLAGDDGFQALLCDLVMPNGSGPELLTWLEANRPKLVPQTVFMSGGGIGPVSSAFFDLHREHIVVKPFDTDALLRRVDELVERAQH